MTPTANIYIPQRGQLLDSSFTFPAKVVKTPEGAVGEASYLRISAKYVDRALIKRSTEQQKLDYREYKRAIFDLMETLGVEYLTVRREWSKGTVELVSYRIICRSSKLISLYWGADEAEKGMHTGSAEGCGETG